MGISIRLGGFFLVVLLSLNLKTYGSQRIVLGWDPSPDSRTAGYSVHVEDLAGNPISRSDVGLNTTATISNLDEGDTYVFYVSAYGYDTFMEETYLLESEPTNRITYRVPRVILSRRYKRP